MSIVLTIILGNYPNAIFAKRNKRYKRKKKTTYQACRSGVSSSTWSQDSSSSDEPGVITNPSMVDDDEPEVLLLLAPLPPLKTCPCSHPDPLLFAGGEEPSAVPSSSPAENPHSSDSERLAPRGDEAISCSLLCRPTESHPLSSESIALSSSAWSFVGDVKLVVGFPDLGEALCARALAFLCSLKMTMVSMRFSVAQTVYQ